MKTKGRKYFKVVSRVGYEGISAKYHSAIFCGACSKEYIPGKFVRANHSLERAGYGLSFFTDLICARTFAERNHDIVNMEGIFEIWEVEVEHVMRDLPAVRLLGFCRNGTVDSVKCVINPYDYWSESIKTKRVWPDKTRMARKIKLLKKITEVK